MRFNECNLNENVLRGTENAGFSECMPVQIEVFNYALEGKDVAVQSQTGTGKTAAFLLSIMELFDRDKTKWGKALVVVPTRELAVQIEKEAQVLGKYLNYKIGSFYGGIGYQVQEKMLAEGVDIVVGTPGRLIDFGKQKKILFKDFGIVVIDEADRLFDMGFLPDLRRMLKQMKPLEKRLTMLFSATLSSRVHRIAWEFMNAPAEISIEPEKMTVEEISQTLYHVSQDEKVSLLLGILKNENPESAIIFTNTKWEAVRLSKRLSANGFPNMYLMGDLPQKKRLKIIERVKAGEQRFLIATDVAARGLHINDLALVVNYDIPEDYENYVHRIGRTARAGKTGKAITLACEKYVYGLEAIEKFIGMKIKTEWPPNEYFVKEQSSGLRFHHTPVSGTRKGPSRPATHKPAHRPKNRVPSEKPEPRKHDHKTIIPKKHVPRKVTPKPKNAPIEDRLAYYREKYGEDFKASPTKESKAETGRKENPQKLVKKKLWKRMKNRFSNK